VKSSGIYDIKIFYLIAYNIRLITHQKVPKFFHDGELSERKGELRLLSTTVLKEMSL
jgi:hypothetical protein